MYTGMLHTVTQGVLGTRKKNGILLLDVEMAGGSKNSTPKIFLLRARSAAREISDSQSNMFVSAGFAVAVAVGL